ncbi:MAG: DUF302 domain-containing protein [Pseudomonadota bacterium]|nr:DUF302 domain-containing protein [Pseudomonadota bacterium]
MFKLIWNLLALTGLLLVAGMIYLATQLGGSLVNLRLFDEKAPGVYLDMARILIETGNAAEATVWKVPVEDGLSWQDVDESMLSVANELNIKNVGELPLSKQVEAMTGKEQRFLKIYMFCNPLTANEMFEYSAAFSAYLPCRISLIEDTEGKLWLYTLNMDMMIHGGTKLPAELKQDTIHVKAVMLEIMDRGAAGDF